MVVSPSGTYRQQIPSLRTGLRSRITEGKSLLQSSIPSDQTAIEDQREKLASSTDKLITAINKIKEVDKAWFLELKTIPEEIEEEERQFYNNFAVDGQNGYYLIIEEAEEVIADLRSRFSRLGRLATTINVSAATPQASSSVSRLGGTATAQTPLPPPTSASTSSHQPPQGLTGGAGHQRPSGGSHQTGVPNPGNPGQAAVPGGSLLSGATGQTTASGGPLPSSSGGQQFASGGSLQLSPSNPFNLPGATSNPGVSGAQSVPGFQSGFPGFSTNQATGGNGPQAPAGVPGQYAGAAHFSSQGGNMRLPKFTLPVFEGDILKFQEFWSLFDAAVHSRSDLSNVTKMSYLLSQLKGEAERTVRGYPVSDKNYAVVLQRLHKRFSKAGDRLRSLLHAELKRIPRCSRDVKEKRATIDECERVFRQLDISLGGSLDPGSALVYDLLSKFPSGMLWDLEKRYHVGVYSDLSLVRDTIENCITEEELTGSFINDLDQHPKGDNPKPKKGASGGGCGSDQGKKKNGSGPGSNNDHTFTANERRKGSPGGGQQKGGNRGKPKTTNGAAGNDQSTCIFCQGAHRPGMCRTYMSGRSRYDRLKELKRCPRCTRVHKGKCETELTCYHCGQPHHSLMCFSHYPGPGRAPGTGLQPGPVGSAVGPPLQQFGHTYFTGDQGQFYPTSFGNGPATGAFGSSQVPFANTQGQGISFFASGPGLPAGATSGTGFFGQNNGPQATGGFNTTPKQYGSGAAAAAGFGGSNGPKAGGGPNANHSSSASEVASFSNSCSKNSIFQTALVQVMNYDTGCSLVLRLCVDTLSNRTYITEKAADQLQLRTNHHDQLYVSVFGSKNTVEVKSRSVSFGLIQRDKCVRHIVANTTRLISNTSFLPSEWPDYALSALQGIGSDLADNPFDPIKSCDILLGADYAWDIIRGGKMDIPNSGMFVIPSVFGYLLGGQLYYGAGQRNHSEYTMLCLTESQSSYPSEIGLICQDTKVDSRYPDIDEFMKLEVIGINDCPIKDDDSAARSSFKETVKFQDGRYHVKWPYIEDKKALLPNNFQTAISRLNSLGPRLQSKPHLLETYRKTIRDQIDRGFIERVPDHQLRTTNLVHYLPHHPVFKPSSATTKVRIVYDASSRNRKDDVSLNECLYRGPVILPDLCQLLIRFRAKDTVVVSDIEKAFLQVALQDEDRDVTRFLWFKNDESPSTNWDNIAVYRFCRVPFGIICSPFLLGATICHHLEHQESAFAKRLVSDIYVDNVISGVPDDMTPLEYYQKTKGIFERAGMNLREFCSNSSELMAQLPKEDRVNDPDTKVLGLGWDSAGGDTLRVTSSTKWKDISEMNSKRDVLKVIASIFDPLGFFQPSIFEAKVFLQKLWALEKGWDEHLREPLMIEWAQIWSSISQVVGVRIPRFIGPVSDESVLIGFGDASCLGYGAVVYLRTRNRAGAWVTNLLISKSRLAPQKRSPKSKKSKTEVSLPRLELLGAYITALALAFCRTALQINNLKLVLFSDSECVLHWLSSQKQLKAFVRRRVEKILSVDQCHFRYVSTDHNPADYLTRGKTVPELLQESTWWHGPTFLNQDEEDWPDTRVPPTSVEVLRRVKEEQQPVNVTFATQETSPPPEFSPLGLKFSDFSSLLRLIRVLCRGFKFLKTWLWDKLSDQTRHRYHLDETLSVFQRGTHMVTPAEFQSALSFVIRGVQASVFGRELTAIRQQRKCLLVSQLNLQLDDAGLLRVCSRFQHADLPEASRYPVLIPKNHAFSKLVVLDIHDQLYHSGPVHTLSELRRSYWVPQGRAYVKRVLKSCVRCKISKSAPVFQLPPMPPWPKERVSRSAPFQFVGVDYFGPMKIKVVDSVHKMWACLFTCLSTRAVHLEAVLDCTSTEFFRSFIRFVSRRGYPQQVISDNGGQFQLTKILADRAWKETPVDDSLLAYSAKHGIHWKFITQLAPWQGGHYERLVGVVKSVLKTAVGRRLVSWSDLITLLTETEAIVNSRPITYVNSDVDATYRVLRPVDFLLFRPVNAPPVGSTEFPVRDLGDAGRVLASVWKQREKYLDKLWTVWYEEYLLNLRERANPLHRRGKLRTDRVPQVGEVVLVKDEALPRGSWKLARIVQVIQGSDKKVRSAAVRLPNGVVLHRTINFLIPLEVSTPVPQTPDDNSELNNHTDTSDQDNNDATTPIGTTQNDSFHGFTDDDVARTAEMLRLFDANGDSDAE